MGLKLVKKQEEEFLDELDKREKPSKTYLEDREYEIFQGIWDIAKNGKPSDSVKLKAFQILYNKLRADKKSYEIGNQMSPIELLERLTAFEKENKED